MNNRRPSSVAAVKGREPFAATAAGSTRATGAGRAQRRRDLGRAGALVRHPEHDQRGGPRRHPRSEGQDQFRRRGRAGDQPHPGGQPQHDPGGTPPRAGQPRRGGHRARHGGGPERRACQRRASEPRPRAGPRRQGARTLPAGQLHDPDHHGARQHGTARQAEQQPVPAVPQRDDYGHGGGRHEHRLHQPGQHPARHRGRRDSGHGRSAGPRIRGISGGGYSQRADQHKPRDDQADDVARMPVASSRQKAVPVRRGCHGWFDVGLGRLGHDSPLVPQPG